jgi:hypothetical protein
MELRTHEHNGSESIFAFAAISLTAMPSKRKLMPVNIQYSYFFDALLLFSDTHTQRSLAALRRLLCVQRIHFRMRGYFHSRPIGFALRTEFGPGSYFFYTSKFYRGHSIGKIRVLARGSGG